ncbi:MAG TPA: hypothetical protein VJN92_20705 [Candidatus Acidoferrum sp.]|nr:hypothetical protein [Candidatus Acidoferrum sp.]
MIVHVAVVSAFEVSAESEAFHPSKEIRVIGECILKRAMLLACLPHENAFTFFQYLRFDDPGIVSEIGDSHLAFEHCVDRFTIAVGTE